ncbi:outer membrane beta-barrel protein [Flavobacterium ginsenosidimutans]|uniref:Outer membrane protein beta-barrel domain-containing protein n=1 Tax=Flavobacterium ginsenosidimutans TaxID=687844 RepID=A0ABZ2QA37_9FLAO
MKKHKIEDIFSSMEDFSSVPPPELWSQIEEKLDKPKKKKRVVLWWSAAACLLLGLLLPSILHFTASPENKNLNNGGFDTNKNSVVLDKKTDDKSTNRNLDQNKNIGKTADSLNENSTRKNQFNTESGIQVQESAVANTNSKNNSNKKDSKYSVPSSANVPNESVAFQNSGSSENKSAGKSSNKSILENTGKSSNKGIAEERIAFGKQNKFNSNAKKQLSNSIFDEKLIGKNNQNFALNNQNNAVNPNTASKQNTSTSRNRNMISETAVVTSAKENGKMISENAVAVSAKENSKSNNSSLSKIDSVQLAELQNLEKGILASTEVKDKKDKKDKKIDPKERWAVAVFAGVANSENTKNDKTLGNTNDSKQSNSYGVKTKYAINNKWAVSSGLKFNELGQSVANVSYISAKSDALFLPGVAYSGNSVAATTGNSEYILLSNSTKEALKDDNVQSGNLDQSLRYIEMPLEVSYSVFNKNRARINLNTGGFVGKLVSNNVSLDGNTIGQNINANDYVYGSTLSSTVQYRVYKKTNVFVEPAMNYYINPLNNQSFNQFQWGLNFGLNVSF